MKEMWGAIEINDGRYEVSNRGRVRNRTTNRILTPHTEKNGYLSVCLCFDGKCLTKHVHRLVALFFLENKEGLPQVNHINGRKDDNRSTNLEWCTAKQNHAHARKMGLIKGSTLFKPVIARNSRETRHFRSITDAAEATGCLKTNIVKCCRKKRKYACGYEWEYA